MENNFPAFLRELREKAGFESQTKFAEACGVDNSTIARLERGETKPMPQTLLKIAPTLQVDINDLMIAAGYITQKKPGLLHLTKDGLDVLGLKEIKPGDLKKYENKKETVLRVPVLGTVKAGFNLIAEEQILGYEYVSKKSVGLGSFFYLNVTGDSMVDAGIEEGYRVLVKHQNFVDDGKIAVVIINGDEGALKRVFYEGSKVILQSENTAKKYPPRIFNAEDVLIQGQVIRVEFDV